MLPTTKLSPTLSASDDELRTKFAALQQRSQVAALLEVPDRYLRYILYGRRDRSRYRVFELPKKAGSPRVIAAPPKNLRILQRKLLRVLTLIYKPRAAVTGFVIGRSIVDNAKLHYGKRHILNIDLADFFPTVHLGRIVGVLRAEPYNVGHEAAITLAQIACTETGVLPQGAPTSPILANMVCGRLDSALLRLAREHRCRYSRYADDISFSTTRRQFPSALAAINPETVILGEALVAAINKNGFKIRETKTRLRSSLRRQMVTGLVVNEFPNVSRRYMRELRALIHDVSIRGLSPAAAKHAEARKIGVPQEPAEWIQKVIRGRLAYLQMVRGKNDPVYRRIARNAIAVLGEGGPPLISLSSLQPAPLRHRSRHSPDWRLWARRFALSVFHVECTHALDSRPRNGTAFLIGRDVLLTAGHNCELRVGGGVHQRLLRVVGPGDLDVPVTILHSEFRGDTGLDIGIVIATLPDAEVRVPLPTQERLPELGEEIAAIGFPTVPLREPGPVLHVGRVESIAPHIKGTRFISVSFPSGLGLSGAPLIDARGFCLGIMVQNTFEQAEQLLGRASGNSTEVKVSREIGGPTERPAVERPYGQAIAIEHWRDVQGVGSRLGRVKCSVTNVTTTEGR